MLYADHGGRIIIIKICSDDATFVLCNIDTPNDDKPHFFVELFTIIEEYMSNLVIIGDFNLVLDTKLDRRSSSYNNDKSQKVVKEKMDEFFLQDIWRIRNTGVKRYSWHSADKKAKKASRIDFALTSHSISNATKICFYHPGIYSDHDVIYLYVETVENLRGKGYWKMNTMLLQQQNYITSMNSYIDQFFQKNYKMEEISKWEFFKLKAAEQTKLYCKNITSDREIALSQLAEKMSMLQEEVDKEYSIDKNKLLQDTKLDLENLQNGKTRACVFRSRAKWTLESGKSTKYFLGLEKARAARKSCSVLLDECNKAIKSPKQILHMQQQFYKNLYMADKSVSFFTKANPEVMVSKEHFLEQGREITGHKLAKAAKELANQKTPGLDRLPVDFYKMFWPKISQSFHQMVMKVYDEKRLLLTATIGVINLIPKLEKDARKLANLRPISILNSDFKIIEKTIDNQMMPALHDIINKNQKGFMPGRRLAANVRKMFDITAHTEENRIDCLILSLDFQKCFDKLDCQAITGTMQHFGFHPYLIKWTEILYAAPKSCMQNNGNMSKRFKVTRGVRQGAPCSSLFFLICAELLATNVRKNNQIMGIPIEDIMNIISQYADDADIFSLFNTQSLNAIFQELNFFQRTTGCTVNYDKTQIYRIGSLKNSDAKLIANRSVTWMNKPIKVLGIWIHYDINQVIKRNYESCIDKAQNILLSWSKRNLCLLSKVQIINSLVMSLFTHKLLVLPSLPATYIRRIEDMVNRFLWNEKKAKIPLKMLYHLKEHRGLKLTDIAKKEQAMKVSWIHIIREDKDMATLAYARIAHPLKEDLWRCNLHIKHVDLFVKDLFWSDVFKAWSIFNYKEEDHPEKTILWLNSQLTVNHRPIFWKKSFELGLKYVHQLFNNGTFKSERLLKQEFGLSVMQSNSLRVSIPKQWITYLRSNNGDTGIHNYDIVCDQTNLSTRIYNHLIFNDSVLRKLCDKWSVELGYTVEYNSLSDTFSDIYKTTNISKYRSFQYRLLHRALITNIQLCK